MLLTLPFFPFPLQPPFTIFSINSSILPFFLARVGKHNVCSLLYPFFLLHVAGDFVAKDLQLIIFASATRNSTVLPSATYWDQYGEITKLNPGLNIAERLWVAWFAWMQNDVLATGIMSFAMHELVYFGRSLPWIFIDTLGIFKRYKIQNVSSVLIPYINATLLTLPPPFRARSLH